MTAVEAIAIGKGKKIAKIGINTVPRPKPENSVMIAASKAVRQMMTYSMASAAYQNPLKLSN